MKKSEQNAMRWGFGNSLEEEIKIMENFPRCLSSIFLDRVNSVKSYHLENPNNCRTCQGYLDESCKLISEGYKHPMTESICEEGGLVIKYQCEEGYYGGFFEINKVDKK